MNAFLTGSRAYGTPREDSDIDLVAMMTSGTLDELAKILDTDDEGESAVMYDGSSATACLRFGNLNLLVVTRIEDYEAWHEGTMELIGRKPVTREEAVELFKAKRAAALAKREAEAADMVVALETDEVAF